MFQITRLKFTPIPQESGIAHHMVMNYKVLTALKDEVVKIHGKPLWFMMLTESARELTCQGE
jgi:hypothetical protein